MQDTFAITIILIVVCTIVGAFIKGRSKDRCLYSFSKSPVTLELTSGKSIWGKLFVENSGLELIYAEGHLDKDEKNIETSYILYKNEYDQIKTLVRYIDDLDEVLLKSRDKELEATKHPASRMKIARRFRNFFGTVRDSLLEVANLFMGRIKTATPAGAVLRGQDKYVTEIQKEAISAVSASYEPILERYIGKKVVLALIHGDRKIEYAGILKDYTTEFIQVMDTQYSGVEQGLPRRADLVAPRSIAKIRHAGE